MAGLFGKILSGLEVVGGAALMFVPGMQLAGAMLITSGIASSGIIGGSVGNFLKSPLAMGLMAAVSLGSTAYAMYGQSVLAGADATAAAATQAQLPALEAGANAAGNTAGAAAVDADLTAGVAGGGDLVPTGSMIAGASGTQVNSFVSAGSAIAGGTTAPAATGVGTVSADANGMPTIAGNESTTANMAMGQQEQATAGAGNPTGGAGPSPHAPGAPMTSGAEGTAPTGANAPNVNTGAETAPGDTAPGDAMKGPGFNVPDSAEAPEAPSQGGFLDKAASILNSKGGAAAVQGAGQMLGGIGGGMAQKAAMEDQIRAQQYAGKTYQNPQAQAQLAHAASAPITVPSGYLQRAQQLRSMLGQTQGYQAPTNPAPALPTPGG